MKVQEFMVKYREAIDEENEAYEALREYPFVRLEGTEWPEEKERFRRLDQRWNKARERVWEVKELLSEVED